MTNQNNQRQLLLGIFFIVALSILAFYTLFLTDIHIFSKPILMTVYFPEANGLREGDPVQLLGARIGRVKDLLPNPTAERTKSIRTILSLDEEVELLAGASITIRESSFLGGRHVYIDPGPFGGPPLEATDGAYFGTVYKNPIAMLGDLGTLLNENREQIKNFLSNADAIVADIRGGKGLLGRAIEDEEMANDAKRFMSNLRETTDKLKDGEGLLSAMIYDRELKTRVIETFDRFQKIGADIEGQRGVLGALIYDQEWHDKIGKGIDSFSNLGGKLDRGEGALGLLLSDEATKNDVKSAVTNFKTASDDIQSITAQVRSGEGTIGRLLKDDTTYKELNRAVGLFTRSLEDYREAAPITAFTAVLFAAF